MGFVWKTAQGFPRQAPSALLVHTDSNWVWEEHIPVVWCQLIKSYFPLFEQCRHFVRFWEYRMAETYPKS